jgi:hypothetical protein
MKTLRLAFAATFIVSLAIGIVPGALHPYSWQVALFDWGVLIALIGPATGFLAGVRYFQIALGVVCVLAALIWGALPFMPTDIDRERSELYVWAYYEALFIAGFILGFGLSKKKPIQPPQTTTGSSAPSRV